MQEEVDESNLGLESEYELSGSVGDGPVVGAAMRVFRRDGELLTEFTSDIAANYNVTVKTKGKHYPLTVEATDGIDMVTLLAPDFRMVSAVLDPGKKTVSNINPFTTIALEMASDMAGGQTISNINVAIDVTVNQLNSGLLTLTSTGPMSTRVDASNIAELIKASETLGETIRRTRDALLVVGQPANGDIIVGSLGSDLTDFVVDGIGGPRADARISAVSTIAAAQTALESMRNQLHVNGSDATNLMIAAVDQILADAPQITLAELVVTEQLLRQARIGVVAAELISPSSELTALRQAMSNVQPGMLPSAVDAILPRSASQLLDHALLAIAAGDDGVLDTVNNTARNGGALPADNRAPTIAGSPVNRISVGVSYEFMPDANDPDGDVLTFNVVNKPAWASFSTSSGQLAGTPGTGDVGIHGGILITVSDGDYSASLGPFEITVDAIVLGSVTLDWTPPTENVDGSPLTDLSGYKIYWGTTSGTYTNSVSIDNAGITSYMIENLAPGTYEFVSTAFNAAGTESGYSNVATIIVP
jgi:hypothetical protein